MREGLALLAAGEAADPPGTATAASMACLDFIATNDAGAMPILPRAAGLEDAGLARRGVARA